MPLIQFNVGGIKKTAFFSFIPKTGGTALIQAFRNLGARIYLHKENNPVVGVLRCPSQHMHYELSNSIIDISAANHSFAVTRHPFSRAKSDYKWAYRKATEPKRILWLDQWLDTLFEQYNKNPYVLDNHLRPQSHFIGPKINAIYRYEEGLENTIRHVLLALKLRPLNNSPTAPQLNTGNHLMTAVIAQHPEHRIARAMEMVEEFYDIDFRNIGFKEMR